MPRGVTKGKGGYMDQWHHDVTDDHGKPKYPPGTRKHHESRHEEHDWKSGHTPHDGDDYHPKEKEHKIAVANAHKKAAEAHEKVLTLKGKQLHADHPYVHTAMKATEAVHKAREDQKKFHSSSEYKAYEKKREAKRDKEREEMKHQAGIMQHKRNLEHAKNPSIPRHDEAKRELADFHAVRKAAKDTKHPDHEKAKSKLRDDPHKYGDHLAKIKESLNVVDAYARYISEQAKSHGKFHTGEAKPISD